MNIVVGYEKEKQEIASIADMLVNAGRYRECGVRIPRGLLLSGEPGVGKTVMARSMVRDGISFVELHISACCDDDAADIIQEKFAEAKEKSPAILLLDELDKVAATNMPFFAQDNDRVRKTLLQELDGLGTEDEVLVVATCNDVDMVSDELVRPGRFDRQISIDLPDENTRLQILKNYFNRIKVIKDFNMEELARSTRGFSGAKLECLANDAGIVAMGKDAPCINEDDIRKVINKLEFGANEKDVSDNREHLTPVAVHETGHAIVAMYLCPDSLCGVSVLPQGCARGHIRFVPGDEDENTSVNSIEKSTAVLLAGHVAERVILGEYYCGSSSDVRHAAINLANLFNGEAAYGYDFVAMGLASKHGDLASERAKEILCKRIQEKMEELDKLAETVICEHRAVYDAIRNALEEKHVLSNDEVLAIRDRIEPAEKAG